VADAIQVCSRVVAGTCDARVRFLNLILVKDIVLREGDRGRDASRYPDRLTSR